VKRSGHTWGQLEKLAQDRDDWRALVRGLCPKLGGRLSSRRVLLTFPFSSSMAELNHYFHLPFGSVYYSKLDRVDKLF